jgi:transcriptional regulator with XRE-family HTH domain
MHTLDDYFAQPDAKSPADIADLAGISESTLSRIRSGKQNTTRDVMRAIIAATGGFVTANALLGLHVAHNSTSTHDASPTNLTQSFPVLDKLADTPLPGEEQQLPFCSAPGARPGVSSPTSSPTTAPPTSSAATASCPACSDPAAAADAGASPKPSCSTPEHFRESGTFAGTQSSSPSAERPRAAETLAGAEDQTPLRSGGTEDGQ